MAKPKAGLLVLQLLTCALVCAQEYSFRNIGTAEGLDNLAVRAIYQDRVGFIWASTENGIYRFDGERFQAFGAAEGIPTNSAAAFGDAPDGSLLVGGSFGLYRLTGNRFTKLTVPFTSVSWAQGIASDGRGSTYIGSDAGLMELTASPGDAEYVVRRIGPPSAGQAAYGVLPEGDAVWFGCGVQLCRMDQSRTKVYGHESGLPGVPLLVIEKDRDGNLWVRARNQGVFKEAAGQLQFARPDAPMTGSEQGSTLTVDNDGRVLIGSPDGLLINDAKGWRMVGRRAGLRGTIYSVFEDRQHSLWIGTAGRGLDQWRGYQEWESYSADSGLGSDLAYEMAPEADGSLWVATEAGLVKGVPGKPGMEWKRVPGLDSMPVHSLATAPSGDLWAGTETKGAARLDKRTGAVEWFGDRRGLLGKAVYSLHFDRRGRLWAASEVGLFEADAPYARFSRVADVPSMRIWKVCEGTDGTIWAGGAGGLFALVNGAWTNWRKDDGLSNEEVLSLGAGQNGTMWVGYRFGGGIDRVRLRPGGVAIDKGVQRRGTDGLVYFLDFDASGKLWVGTEKGVDVWDGLRWNHYDTTDGLAWDDCDLGGFAQGPDGAIWIGTSGGLSRYKPRPHPAIQSPPAVVFTQLRLGQTDVSSARNPAFAAESSSLIARYSALNAARENGVVYRYRLEGANSTWTETTERSLHFARLAPGTYRLEVEASDSQGAWSEHRAEFAFSVLSPWYRRWWFIGICMLIPLLAAAGILRLRFLNARRRESELMRIVEEKTRDLRLANENLLELSTLDPLTGLSNRRVFDQTLMKECARLKRGDSRVSLIIFDADHFKALNDSEGHQRGDEYLVLIARELIRTARRNIDVAARYGGEEFALILPATQTLDAVEIAESVLLAIANLELPHPSSPVAPILTVSAGVATATPQSWCSPEELVAAADQALYRAKREGRNRVVVCRVETASPVE